MPQPSGSLTTPIISRQRRAESVDTPMTDDIAQPALTALQASLATLRKWVKDYNGLTLEEGEELQDDGLREFPLIDVSTVAFGRIPLSESVAESLLRELFDGKVEVALAGNPITIERLEARIRAFFQWKSNPAKPHHAHRIWRDGEWLYPGDPGYHLKVEDE